MMIPYGGERTVVTTSGGRAVSACLYMPKGIYIYVCMYIYIYMYIYIEREG